MSASVSRNSPPRDRFTEYATRNDDARPELDLHRVRHPVVFAVGTCSAPQYHDDPAWRREHVTVRDRALTAPPTVQPCRRTPCAHAASSQQAIEQALEVVEVHVPDLDPAGLAGLVLGDRRPGRRARGSAAPRGRAPTPTSPRRLARLAGARARAPRRLLDQRLGRAHRELLVDHRRARRARSRPARRARAARARGPSTAARPRPSGAPAPGSLSSRIAFATVLRSLPIRSAISLLRQPELVDQPLVRGGLLERPEVGALEVLDEGALERDALLDVLHDDRHLVQPGALRRAPPPLAGDQEVAAVRARPDDERHDDAVHLIESASSPSLASSKLAARLLRARVERPRSRRRSTSAGAPAATGAAAAGDVRDRAPRDGPLGISADRPRPRPRFFDVRHHRGAPASGCVVPFGASTINVRSRNSSATAR